MSDVRFDSSTIYSNSPPEIEASRPFFARPLLPYEGCNTAIKCINRTRHSRITGHGIEGIKPPDCGQFCNPPGTGGTPKQSTQNKKPPGGSRTAFEVLGLSADTISALAEPALNCSTTTLMTPLLESLLFLRVSLN